MNKGFAVFLVVLLAIVGVGLTVGLILLLGKGFTFKGFSFNSYSENLVEEKTIDNIKDLDIIANIADTFIEESDDNKIKIELYSEDPEEHSINEEEDIIKTVLKHKKVKFNFFSKQDKIVIKLPKDYNKKINTDFRTGDLNIESFENAEAFIKTTTGDVKIKKINNAEIELSTGDIEIDYVKDLKAKGTTGNIDVKEVDNIEVKITTGDVDIERVNNKVEIKTTTGDIKISEATINENSYIEGTTGNVKISKLTGAYIDASAKVGDTKINNNDRTLEHEIKIKTTTGDIKVN